MTLNEIKVQNQSMAMTRMEKPKTEKVEQEITPKETYEQVNDKYEEEISLKQAGKGLVGSAIGIVGDGVGMTGTALVNLPRIVKDSYVALAKTEAIGRNLKIVTGAVGIPLATALVAVLSPVAGAVYGAVKGAYDGAKKGIAGAAKGVAKDVKSLHKELKGEKLNELFDEIENAKPEEGKKPFDIRLKESVQATVGGLAGTVIGGVGHGAITARHELPFYKNAMKTLWKTDGMGPILKGTITAVSIPVAVLAVPLATIGGALWGLGESMGKGYQKGVKAAVKGAVDRVKKSNAQIKEWKNDMA